jgi:L-alanine-DL-glutamate epimerase-like enolase superfamily enzyme
VILWRDRSLRPGRIHPAGAFDANSGYSVGGAIGVKRALEGPGFSWFEETVLDYRVRAMGDEARALDITVSAGEQTYTLFSLADFIATGVHMVQPAAAVAIKYMLAACRWPPCNHAAASTHTEAPLAHGSERLTATWGLHINRVGWKGY